MRIRSLHVVHLAGRPLKPLPYTIVAYCSTHCKMRSGFIWSERQPHDGVDGSKTGTKLLLEASSLPVQGCELLLCLHMRS